MEVDLQKELLLRWYDLMKAGEKEKASERKERISALYLSHLNEEMTQFYKLLELKYHILCEDYDRAEQTLAEASLSVFDERHWLNYYYNFFKGSYHY
ncbi:MAG TPA: hypothetical protein VFK44_09095, partial [Bacillales bacterium]|nr:hypothetical protein [Bacillales bacterium]